MKRRLRNLLMAGIAILGSWSYTSAYTVDDLTSAGWTKVDNIASIDVTNKLFVFVDAKTSGFAMSNVTNNGRAVYNTLADPVSNPSQTWILEGSGDTYALKNAHSKFYFNSGDAGWNNYLDQANNDANYKYALADGKYSLTSTRTNQLLGPWNNDANVYDGEQLAANKSGSQAPGFFIYSMSMTDYTAKRTTLVSAATKESPIDVTSYIYNPDFASNSHYGWTQTGGYGNRQYGSGTMEAWNINNANISQQITGLPNGVYKVTADVISGPGVPLNAYVYASAGNEVKSGAVTAVASAGNYGTMSNEVAGKTLAAENVNVVNGTMTIGVKDPSTGNGWIVLDNFKLYYYGVDLSALEEALQEKITEAQAIDQTNLNNGFKDVLNNAITAAQNAEYTEEDLTAQTIALGNTITLVNNAIIAITETNNLIAIYQGYATNSTAPDKSAFNTAISTAETNLANATTIDAIKAVEEDLQEALLAYLDSGASPTEGYPFDLTFKVINPEFATDLSGWTGTGTQRWYPDAVGFDGNGFVEYCNWGGAWEGAVSQTISGLPNGTYIIKAAYQASASELTMTLTANDIATNLVCIDNTGGNIAQGGEIVAAGSGYQGWQYGEVQCKVTDGTLTIKGSSAATVAQRWANFDHVIVSYVSALDLSEIIAAYETALADAQATAAKTNDAEASLKTALATAITTYGDVNRTNQALMEEATAALSATTTNVNNSISAYASAKAYLDRMALALENTNVYTQEAYNAHYGTYLSEYNAGTLATATAATLNANLAYRIDNGYKQANNLDEILLSTWMIGGEKPTNYDKALYINTWSVEGATDGSEFLAPFFEYWTGDANSLEAKTLQATITGLKPSTTYSFTIRARVRQTNDQTKIANGITMQVGSGETVDISSGTIFGTGPFYIGNFSAVGETDAEGTLTATITVAANSNISWLSFYNAKYTEGEDLSAYIADYEFALANAQTALTKNMDPKLRSNLQDVVNTYSSVDTTDKAALIAAKEALEAANNSAIAKSIAELEGSSINGWSRTGNSANFEVNTWSGEGATDGSNMTTPFLQNWQRKENGALGDAVMTYTLTDQAQGYYRVSALIRSLNENGGAAPAGTFIFANTAIERAYNGTACTNGVYDEPEVYGYVGADGNLSIGVKVIRANVNWVSFKNFKVEYVGTELTNDMVSNLTEEAPSFTYNTTAQATLGAAVSALSGTQNADNYVAAGSAIETAYRTRDVDFTELNTAIANAEAAASGKVLGFATGEYAPYNNVEVITALATAKAIDQATATDQTVIINATNALNAASWNENTEEVNAIYDGSFEYAYSTDGNVKPFGWHATNDRDNATNVRYMWDATANAGLNATTTGKALFTKFEAYYGQEAGYTMPLKANTIYELTFVYGGWSDCKKDGYVTMTAPNGDNIEVTVSRLPLDATNGHQDATVWKSYKARFETTEAGDYVLGLRKDDETQQSQYVYGDMKLFTAKAEDINFTFKADYGTLILPFNAELQEGMEAYTCDGKEENELTLTLTPAESFVANTPYIVKKTGATTDYTFNGIAFSFANSYTEGLLTGTLVDMTAPAGSLVLQNQPSGLGFYQVDTNDITVKANRVYVTEEVAGVNVRALILPGNETGINNVAAEDSIVDVYTIGGVKVKEGVKASEALNGLAKGFYIVGGKKVMK